MKTNKFLECPKGNKSSKRLFSAILLAVGLSMAIIAYSIALFKPIGDAKLIIELVAIILGLGSGLSGITIFDTIFNRSKK